MNFPRIHRSKSSISILSQEDYSRIRQNAKDSELKEKQNEKIIGLQQKEFQLSKARAHLKWMKEYDLQRQDYYYYHTHRAQDAKNKKILFFAQQCKENGLDLSKRMDQILKYAKCVNIRDEQKILNKKLKSELKKKEEKLDLIMELERLKGLKKEEEEKNMKKIKRLEEKKIIIEQMKNKKIKKEKEKLAVIKEGEELQKYLKKLELEDIIKEQQKQVDKINLAKEIVETNKLLALNKSKLQQEERENDLKLLQYNMEKSKEKEEEMRLKKIIEIQKEIETQKLREKQEKLTDENALLDELRAKRYVDEINKREREKELKEAKKLIKQKKELIEINEEQKNKKNDRLLQQALIEEKEYENIIKYQIKEREEEKILEKLKRKIIEENGKDLIRQIQVKKDKKLFQKRYALEEGRKIKQEQDKYIKTLEKIKKQKLDEMEKMGIKPKYRVDLEKIKIV
jgi:hypothetical protein